MSQTSNPLLADPAIHADLKPLFDAVVMVAVRSQDIARCYSEMLAVKESSGMPTADEWPDSPALELARAQHSEWARAIRADHAARGEDVMGLDFPEPRWTELMREWSGCYRDWCAAIANAKDLAKSPAVAAIMDAGELRPAHQWTTQAIIDLDNLAGTLHPIGTGGVDGLGFIRCGLPPLPPSFSARTEAVGKRIGELRSIRVSAVPPAATVSVSPDLLNRLEAAAGMKTSAAPTVTLQRPVKVAAAAKALNMRCDVLLKRLRDRRYPIGGVRGSYEADLSHVLLSVDPVLRRQLKKWAEKNSPA